MNFRFLSARFVIVAISAIVMQLAMPKLPLAAEEDGLPTIEIHLEALDKFYPAADIQEPSTDKIATKKKHYKKPVNTNKEPAKPTAPKEKTTNTSKNAAPVEKKIEKTIQKTETKPEQKAESKEAQKAVDKALEKTNTKESVFEDNIAPEKKEEAKDSAALPKTPTAEPVVSPAPIVPPAPVAPAAPKAEETPKVNTPETSAADIAEAQKALAPIAEIKPQVPAAAPDAPPAMPAPVIPAAPAAPAAVDLTPMPPPPSPAGEMAAAIAPLPTAPTAPTVPAVDAPKAEASVPAAPETKSVAPKTAPDLTIKFLSTETSVPLSTQADLKKLIEKMNANGNRVLVFSYASGSGDKATTARRVSLSRALAVRAFLIENDVDKLKINVQAEGDKSAGGEPDRVDMFIVK